MSLEQETDTVVLEKPTPEPRLTHRVCCMVNFKEDFKPTRAVCGKVIKGGNRSTLGAHSPIELCVVCEDMETWAHDCPEGGTCFRRKF